MLSRRNFIKDNVENYFDRGDSMPKTLPKKRTKKSRFSWNFNMDSKTVKLNSGYDMPIIGLGTWQLTGDTVENSVYGAIKDGYRLIDTAYWYGNEKNVGNAVRKAISEGIVTRDELFITTKLPPYGFDDYEKAIDECNERLGLDYIDLIRFGEE